MKRKYTLYTWTRKVTVWARTKADAVDKARAELDRRHAKDGLEPPISHTLYSRKPA